MVVKLCFLIVLLMFLLEGCVRSLMIVLMSFS